MSKYGIYLISDPKYNFDKVEDALQTGLIKYFQYRNKNASDSQFIYEANQYAVLCNKYQTKLIINDRVHLIDEIEAFGIHVGQSDTAVTVCKKMYPNHLVGVSAHTLEEAKNAVLDGADYVGIGAMFSTKTKLDATPVDLDTLIQIRDECNINIVTIGGISTENVNTLIPHCDGLAICSDILEKDKPSETVKTYQRILETSL